MALQAQNAGGVTLSSGEEALLTHAGTSYLLSVGEAFVFAGTVCEDAGPSPSYLLILAE